MTAFPTPVIPLDAQYTHSGWGINFRPAPDRSNPPPRSEMGYEVATAEVKPGRIFSGFTSAFEVDALVVGSEVAYSDYGDAQFKRGMVPVDQISHWETTSHRAPYPLTGDEDPVVLTPNPGQGVRPDAQWFAEDGSHRLTAARLFGVKTVDAFFVALPAGRSWS